MTRRVPRQKLLDGWSFDRIYDRRVHFSKRASGAYIKRRLRLALRQLFKRDLKETLAEAETP